MFKSILKLGIILGLGLVTSCSSPKFVKGGYFLNGIDRYFNPKEETNIWVYYNFRPRETGQMGLKIQSLYLQDKEMLKNAGLLKNGNKVMFSVVPDNPPYYNMLVLQHNNPIKDLEGYQMLKNGESKYYQKDLEIDKFLLRHYYIPVANKKSISMLSYISKKENRFKPFNQFDYLAKINAAALQLEKNYRMSWRISGMDGSPNSKARISVPQELFKKEKKLLLMVSEEINKEWILSYFQLVTNKDANPLQIDLPPGKFLVQFLNEKEQILKEEIMEPTNQQSIIPIN
ncbi:hypothetical protein ACP6L2_09595 [Sphingobacterium lactis]|uniref:hypothetical protein n=1 Tax=Sphingobacterium lactis TaxID=797291 RepID=UPI003F7EFB13